jgi:hypothetical protein
MVAHLLCRHTDAGVRYRQRDPVAAILLSLLYIDADGATVGELVAVAHKIEQRLPKPRYHRLMKSSATFS